MKEEIIKIICAIELRDGEITKAANKITALHKKEMVKELEQLASIPSMSAANVPDGTMVFDTGTAQRETLRNRIKQLQEEYNVE